MLRQNFPQQKKVVRRFFSRRDFPTTKLSRGETVVRRDLPQWNYPRLNFWSPIFRREPTCFRFYHSIIFSKNSSLPIQAGKKRDLIIRFNYLIIRCFIIRESFSNNSLLPIGDSIAQYLKTGKKRIGFCRFNHPVICIVHSVIILPHRIHKYIFWWFTNLAKRKSFQILFLKNSIYIFFYLWLKIY